jgi:hypothetical protein
MAFKDQIVVSHGGGHVRFAVCVVDPRCLPTPSYHVRHMLRHSMSNENAPVSSPFPHRIEGLGCAVTLAAINLIAMGFIAYTFARMFYFDAGQERWYRGGSLAFLVLGALVPICWLVLIRRGYWGSAKAIAAWMFVALLAFTVYVLLSGGGI